MPWTQAPCVDTALLKAVVRTHRWREMLESGKYPSAAELVKAEKVNDFYLSRVLQITLLAPEIIEAIVCGQQPSTLQVDDIRKPRPARWRGKTSILLGR